ncbi:hypothetical protein D3C84_1139570 [compost metagenome]
MRFIDDEHIVLKAHHNIAMRISFSGIHGGYNDVSLLPHVGFLMRDGRDAEFGIQFPNPLQNKGSGYEDERFADKPADHVFF